MSESEQLFKNWQKKIAGLTGDEDFQNLIEQINSKALLTELHASLDKNWTFPESQIGRIATTLSFIIQTMEITDHSLLKPIQLSILRLALLWENLSRIKEKTAANKALLNSAIAYQIAGYQANSVCLSKKIRKEIDDEYSIEHMIILFLQKRFLQLKQTCNYLLTDREKIDDQDKAIQQLSKLIIAKGFSEVCNYFLTGDETSIPKAKESFSKAEDLFQNLGLVNEFNLCKGSQALLPSMERNSTWKHLKKIFENNLIWERYLKLLSRGIGANLLNVSSICELWPSQLTALENDLLDERLNKVVKMPTSAGKTRIAELAMAYTLIKDRNSKCVYVAPYRALVTELEDTFLNLFKDLGFKITSVYGNYETDPFQRDLANDADILVITPEKLDLLFRAESEFLNNVKLFILDEGHIINSTRGVKFELLLTRLKTKLSNSRFLFLSAVISDETIKEFLQWFGNEESKLIQDGWRPSIQRHAKFVWQGKYGKLEYEQHQENKLIEGFVPGVITQRTYKTFNELGKIERVPFPTNTKVDAAAELAYKFSELGSTLVFCVSPRAVETVATRLQKRLSYTKQEESTLEAFFDESVESSEIQPYFQERDTRSLRISLQLFGKEHVITKFLRNGIAIHHGELPDILRRAIESDFREKKYRIIIATNTLAQGVNLPIRTVIIHECFRYNRESRHREPIPVSDYWNIAGRAGRAGQETEGTVVHIVQTRLDEDAYNHYLSNQKQLEPIQGMLYGLLKKLIESRISMDDLRKELDPEILALLVEEDPDFIERNIKQILENSFVKQQTNSSNLSILIDAFQKITKSIIEEIPDPNHRRVYSMTGLSAKSCQSLHTFIEDRKTVFLSYLTNSDSLDLSEIIPVFLEALKQLPEMIPRRELPVDNTQLLIKWLEGNSYASLCKKFEVDDNLKLIKFVEEYFSYLLPWGMSSLLQIAQKILGLEESDIDNSVKYLPSMIKYGVPLTEAAWAMTVGIPFRDIAIRIGATFKRENSENDFGKFRNWISSLDHDVLRYEYGVEGPFLEDVTKALTKSSINPFLVENYTIDQVLAKPVWISGIKYEQRRIVAYSAKVNDEVELKREYDNMYDRNAIRVSLHNNELGYLSRDLAQFLAPHMDCGLTIYGKISKIEHAEIPRIEIKINKTN